MNDGTKQTETTASCRCIMTSVMKYGVASLLDQLRNSYNEIAMRNTFLYLGFFAMCALSVLSSCGSYTLNYSIETPSSYGNNVLIEALGCFYRKDTNTAYGFIHECSLNQGIQTRLTQGERHSSRIPGHRLKAIFKAADGGVWEVSSGYFNPRYVKVILLCNDGKVRILNKDNTLVSPGKKPMYLGKIDKAKDDHMWIMEIPKPLPSSYSPVAYSTFCDNEE